MLRAAMRSFAAALAAAFLLAAAPAGAATTASATAAITPSVGWSAAQPAATALGLAVAVDDAAQPVPATLESVRVGLPSELVLDPRAVARCSLATLDAGGPSACPGAV